MKTKMLFPDEFTQFFDLKKLTQALPRAPLPP